MSDGNKDNTAIVKDCSFFIIIIIISYYYSYSKSHGQY